MKVLKVLSDSLNKILLTALKEEARISASVWEALMEILSLIPVSFRTV